MHEVFFLRPVTAPEKALLLPDLYDLSGNGILISAGPVAAGLYPGQGHHRVVIPVQINHAAIAVMGTEINASHFSPGK